MTNDKVYGNLRKATDIIKERRTKFCGHCWRSKEETIHKLLLWQLLHGKRLRGRPSRTFIDQIEEDISIAKEILSGAMADRKYWRECVNANRLWSIRWMMMMNI